MYPDNRYPPHHAMPRPNMELISQGGGGMAPVVVKQEPGGMLPPPPRFNQTLPPQFNQMLPPPPRHDFQAMPPPSFRPRPSRWDSSGPPAHMQHNPSRWGNGRPLQMGPPRGVGYQGYNSRPGSGGMLPPPRAEPPARVLMPPCVKLETPARPPAPHARPHPPLAASKQEGGGGPGCNRKMVKGMKEPKDKLKGLPRLKARFGPTFERAYGEWRQFKDGAGADGGCKRAAPGDEEKDGFAHVVFVVDGSGSMRTCDATGKDGKQVARYKAVFECCRDFVRDQLHAQGDGSRDVYSMLSFKEQGEVLLDRAPLNDALFQLIDGAERRFKPSHGTHFGPAFAALSELVGRRGHPPPDRLLVVFLSDGRPGDLTKGQASVNPALQSIVNFLAYLRVAVFTFRAVLVGDDADAPIWLQFLADVFGGKFIHATLDARQQAGDTAAPPLAAAGGGAGAVQIKTEPGLPPPCRPPSSALPPVPTMLRPTATTLSSTFTTISRELTSLRTSSMAEQQRKRLRTARLEAPDAWQQHAMAVVKREAGGGGDRVFTAHRLVFNFDEDRFDKEAGERTVRVRTVPFAQGGLRLCFHMFDETPTDHRPGASQATGRIHLVGKESRYLEQYKERLAFHRDSFRCHRVAESIAQAFNDRLEKMNPGKIRGFGFHEGVPHVSFLPPVIYRLADPDSPGGFRYLAAEDHLEAPYRKYNGNNGYVLPATTEGVSPLELDIPQAFSHFSYHHSNAKLLVCDLQGRGCDRRYTDPQVHSSSSKEGKTSVYGKADLGKAGIESFFRTHTCNAVCQALRLIAPPGFKSGVATQS